MSNHAPTTVLVTGATGYVGTHLVPCLLEQGYRVRCLVRTPERLRRYRWSTDVDIVAGDALDAETLLPAVRNVDVVFYLIHSLGAGERAFEERDRRAAINVRQAAEAAGVRRIIYLGGMRPKGERRSRHLESRMVTGNVLRNGAIPVTEFRAAQIVGAGSLSFELVRYLTERVPVLVCPRWVQTPTQPIAIDDVLQYLVAAIEQPESTGRIVEIGGADVLTYAQMFEIYAGVRGLERWIVNLPFLTPRLSSHWVGLVTPISNRVARPLIEGLDNEVIVDDPSIARHLFPDIQPISFEAAVRLALRRAVSDPSDRDWTEPDAPSGTEPTVRVELRDGIYREDWTIDVEAPASIAFETIERLGGDTGSLYGDALWRLRGWFDRLTGGPGYRQGRRDPNEMHVGDPVHFWRVEAREKDQFVRLRGEMNLPGRAWLQYEVIPLNDTRTRMRQTVFFAPKGLYGTVYWTLVRPLHKLVLNRQLLALAGWIEERTADRSETAPPKVGVS